MTRKRAGLGRGLAELLGEPSEIDGGVVAGSGPAVVSSAEAPIAAGGAGVLQLPIASLRPNPLQPRRAMDIEGLKQLAESIEAVGVVQPVIVRPLGDGYELIAGERRWRAAQMAGFTVVPAILRQASDTESLEIALVENVVRQDLNPVDEAYALQILLDDLGVTQETLASRVGMSRSAIANKVRLLELPSSVQDLLSSGALAEGHGRALLGVRSRGRLLTLARRAARTGMSVRAVEAEARRLAKEADAALRTPGRPLCLVCPLT